MIKTIGYEEISIAQLVEGVGVHLHYQGSSPLAQLLAAYNVTLFLLGWSTFCFRIRRYTISNVVIQDNGAKFVTFITLKEYIIRCKQ